MYSGINRGEKDIAAIRLRDMIDEGLNRRVSLRDGKNFQAFYGKVETALQAFCDEEPLAKLTPAKAELFPLAGERLPCADGNGDDVRERPKAHGRLVGVPA
jgi:hypothetical protein